MPERMLVQYCAPTLAGLKTGSLFSCPYCSGAELRGRLRAWNMALRPSGLCVLPLRWSEGRALIYVVRPAALREDLSCAETRKMLDGAGYPVQAARCVVELTRRLAAGRRFPHEIGLFLGYPPEDVRGFLEHRGKDYKCVGCWKVYGDAERAMALFRRYQRCTADCAERLALGAALDTLAARQREV